MREFFRKNGIIVVIAALLLTAAVSIGSALIPMDPLANALGVLATPFRAIGTAVTGWGQGVYRYATEYDALRQRVAELEGQVAQMEQENREANAALRENERLRQLLELREKRADFVFESAAVTGRTVTSSHGVSQGDCVITETGALVGVVREAGLNWSTVSTVLDPDISLGAQVFSTGEDGILEGDLTLMTEGKCRLSYLSVQSETEKGDQVLTSGMGGIYPSGLVIGTVERVDYLPSGAERYAVLAPAADLDRLEEVFVIKDFQIVE